MDNASTLCARYEVAVNKYRTRPKTENEIIVETWSKVTQTLEERSFQKGIDPERKKAMRMAAREIRHAMAKAGHVKSHNKALIDAAEDICYAVMSEALESLLQDIDAMARLIVARHPIARRINQCRMRLAHAFDVMMENIQTLKTPKKEKQNEHE